MCVCGCKQCSLCLQSLRLEFDLPGQCYTFLMGDEEQCDQCATKLSCESVIGCGVGVQCRCGGCGVGIQMWVCRCGVYSCGVGVQM